MWRLSVNLMNQLSPFQIGFITSDDWGSYAKKTK